MRHPSDRVLHDLVAEPARVPDTDRDHVTGCSRCLARLDGAGAGPDGARRGRIPGRTPRRALRHPAVAAVLAVGVVAGAGAAAANDWLPIFRTEQVAPVAFDPADLVTLPDLSAFGDLAVDSTGEPREVPDAATAATQTGLDVPSVADLPQGVTGAPTYLVGDETTATFTFSADRAADAAAAAGTTLPAPPAGLDGSQLRMTGGPGVVQVWAQEQGVPSLVVGRGVAPTASTSGVDLATARDYLLSLPGVPADVAAQLRTFTGDGTTLPLPVPADRVTTSTATVGGATATVLEVPEVSMAAVVWVEDGIVTAVGGPLDVDELLAVARDLG